MTDIELRNASLTDTEMIYEWRNDPFIVSLSSSQKTVTLAEHRAWMESALKDETKRIFIIECNNTPVGQVRFEKMNESECVISVYLLEEFTAKGLGTQAIRAGCGQIAKIWPGISIFAFVRSDNDRGARAFQKTGFTIHPHPAQPREHKSFVLRAALPLVTEQADDQTNIRLYANLLEKYGNDVRSLNWGSVDSQHKRFEVLASIGDLQGKSILDVGCGLGDFYSWLKQRGKDVDYYGIDITPQMVERARQKYPKGTFETGSILEVHFSQDFDYVFASGIFYLRNFEPEKFLHNSIRKMFANCRLGLGFNSLSRWADSYEENEFYADPAAVVNFCRSLSRKVVLRHDYHPADFTIYLYK
ncbi:MAG: GNAT family N-acetyltransferase [Bacteroidota bacterium]